MKSTVKKRLVGITALLALVAGAYVATDGIAHGPASGQMMGGQPGMNRTQGMGPGMMTGQPGTYQNRGMGPGMMTGQPGTYQSRGMGPGLMMGQPGSYQNRGMGPRMMMGRGSGGQRGMGMMGGPGGFAGMTADPAALDSYLADTKTRLNITAEQETAWNAYAEAVKSNTTTHTELHNTMHGTTDQNALEQQEQHLTAMDTMIAGKKAEFTAYKNLYATLDENQQKIANQLTWSCHG